MFTCAFRVFGVVDSNPRTKAAPRLMLAHQMNPRGLTTEKGWLMTDSIPQPEAPWWRCTICGHKEFLHHASRGCLQIIDVRCKAHELNLLCGCGGDA